MTGPHRRLLGVSLAAACLVLADTAAWLWVCSRLQAGVAQAVGQLAAAGWTARSGLPVREGWPFAARLDFPGVSVVGDPAVIPGGLLWTAEHVTVGLSLAHPTLLKAAVTGAQVLQADAQPPVPLRARSETLEAGLSGEPSPVLSIAELAADLPAGAVSVGAGTIRFAPEGVLLDVQELGLPGLAGTTIDRLRLQGGIAPMPAGPLSAARAQAWRDAGGTLTLDEAALTWGPLQATGHAEIKLDAQLQPVASGTVDAAGLPAAIDALTRSGALPARTALAAKAVLALLAAPSPGAPVSLPVQLQNRVLSVARFPLLRLPVVGWE